MEPVSTAEVALRLPQKEELETSLLNSLVLLDASGDSSNELSNQVLADMEAAGPTFDAVAVSSLDKLLQEEDDPPVHATAVCTLLAPGAMPWYPDRATLLFPEPEELWEQITELPNASPTRDTTSATPTTLGTNSDGGDDTPNVLPPVPPVRRKRLKHELDFLRDKARELEKELAELQKRDADSEAPVDSTPKSPDTQGATEDSVAKTSVWKRVSRRQFEGKQRAERENRRLRGMVQEQLGVVQNLEKILRKRSALEASDTWMKERKRVRVLNESEDAVFAKLLGQLDDQYRDTDAVLRENAHAQLKREGHHVQVKPDSVNGMFMEFLTSKVVPFGLHVTGKELWATFAQRQMQLRDGHYSVADGTDDTMSAKMAFTVRRKQHEVLKDAKFVVKRFVEEERYVFAWCCETTTEGSLGAAQRVTLHDFGWTVLEPVPIADEGDDEVSTIIQSCVRVRTTLPEALPHSQDEVALLSDMVTGSYLDNMDGIHQSVEDRLVDKAMREEHEQP